MLWVLTVVVRIIHKSIIDTYILFNHSRSHSIIVDLILRESTHCILFNHGTSHPW